MYLSHTLTILRLVGNRDVSQVCRSTRFLPSVVSLEKLHTSYPAKAAEIAAEPYPHGAVQHGDGI